jgi:hypothetical protein
VILPTLVFPAIILSFKKVTLRARQEVFMEGDNIFLIIIDNFRPAAQALYYPFIKNYYFTYLL